MVFPVCGQISKRKRQKKPHVSAVIWGQVPEKSPKGLGFHCFFHASIEVQLDSPNTVDICFLGGSTEPTPSLMGAGPSNKNKPGLGSNSIGFTSKSLGVSIGKGNDWIYPPSPPKYIYIYLYIYIYRYIYIYIYISKTQPKTQHQSKKAELVFAWGKTAAMACFSFGQFSGHCPVQSLHLVGGDDGRRRGATLQNGPMAVFIAKHRRLGFGCFWCSHRAGWCGSVWVLEFFPLKNLKSSLRT